MKKLVFIASLSHSGSTILDLILGGHSRFVGLGEIVRVLRPGPTAWKKTRKLLCSCNKKMDQCIFWGKVASLLGKNQRLSIEEKYQVVLDTFEMVFGPHCIPVDSSKYMGPHRC